ncbi:hypothetical protein TUBRATIS_009750, partial [Tubulinosema ratisbonensis]
QHTPLTTTRQQSNKDSLPLFSAPFYEKYKDKIEQALACTGNKYISSTHLIDNDALVLNNLAPLKLHQERYKFINKMIFLISMERRKYKMTWDQGSLCRLATIIYDNFHGDLFKITTFFGYTCFASNGYCNLYESVTDESDSTLIHHARGEHPFSMKTVLSSISEWNSLNLYGRSLKDGYDLVYFIAKIFLFKDSSQKVDMFVERFKEFNLLTLHFLLCS